MNYFASDLFVLVDDKSQKAKQPISHASVKIHSKVFSHNCI